jgi:uncharacterized protein (DUF2126 family)
VRIGRTGYDRCVAAALPVVERLADSFYLSTLHEIVNYRRLPEGIPVRIVEYTVDDPGRPIAEPRYRLLTTILDPSAAPAAELAAAQRWEFETTLDELKTHQRGPRVVLRSKTPDGVTQEVWATFACITPSAG